MKRKDLLFYILLLLISIPVSAGWQRPVTNYTRHTYKAGNQNWSIQQHDNGWIYIANNKGLLEFDGVDMTGGFISVEWSNLAILLQIVLVGWSILAFLTVYLPM